jgi:DNA repair protein RadD
MLRDYQETVKTGVFARWDRGATNVIAVMPTGAGKTVTMTSVCQEVDDPSIAVAHRQELVAQISLAFAKAEVNHRIIAPVKMIRAVMAEHMVELGECYVRHNARVAVAGVDTLIRRPDDEFFQSVRLWQTDEAHHLLEANKWGQAVARFPRARGLGWTATPLRTDRKSLKRGSGGVFDDMVVGPSMRELIDRGYLAPYEIYGLPQAINTANVAVGGSGEFVQSELSQEAHASRITGDIVEHYLHLAAGKSGVTFAVDVALAEEHAAAFRDAGVSAAVIHAKTPMSQRIEIIRAFRNRELMQIVNVDVLGEGFDCPGIEVVSMARPTMSLGLFVQQFGRGLRIKEGKRCGLILDHVGNVVRHGPPDGPRNWTLEPRGRKNAEPQVKVAICGNPDCMRVYEGYEPACPYCGWEPVRSGSERQRPQAVDGDLTLYTPELLAQLRRDVNRVAGPVMAPRGMSEVARMALERRWENRQDAQTQLSHAIDHWAGHYVNGRGESIRAAHRRFFHTFGMDTLSALAQSGPEMVSMLDRVNGDRK